METIRDIAFRLAERRLTLTPPDRAPLFAVLDDAAAYELQAQTNAIISLKRGPVVGLKIGCTTPVMQKFLNIHSPAAGEIFAQTIHEGYIILDHQQYRRLGVECEIAIRIARDIDPTDDIKDVRSIISSVHAAVELVDNRYDDFSSFGVFRLIADNFFNAGAVVGPAIKNAHALALDKLSGRMVINGREVGQGYGASVMGHPFNALSWLIAQRQKSGYILPKDSLVLLGSIVETKWVNPGDTIEIEIDQLGSLSLAIA